MTERMTRREWLRAGWKGLVKGAVRAFEEAAPAPAAGGGSRQSAEREAVERYFASPLSSYPLVHEMPLEMLLEEACRRGIPTEGRGKREIAADLFLGVGGRRPEAGER